MLGRFGVAISLLASCYSANADVLMLVVLVLFCQAARVFARPATPKPSQTHGDAHVCILEYSRRRLEYLSVTALGYDEMVHSDMQSVGPQ